jgi:hypothetical protein
MPVKPVIAAFLAALAGAEARAAGEGCPGPAAGAPAVRLAGLDPAGDILLEDGRRVRLVGLAARQDDAEAERFAAGIAKWTGKAFSLVALAGPDRWGRLPARLLAAPQSPQVPPVDLALAMLRSHAGVRAPEPDHPACDLALRAALGEGAALSAQARAPGEAAVDGHDIAALKAQAGRIVALKGSIASVGERAQRTYLNLSRRRGEGASIVMSRKLWREMQDKGFTAATLPGKRLLARGVLSGQEGLLLEIASVSALDVID